MSAVGDTSPLRIDNLATQNLRNLVDQRLNFAEGLNCFVGINGAGKTSLLEAIHLLASGRSFRTNQTVDLISHGQECATVAAEINEAGEDHRLGLSRCRSGLRLRRDGVDVARMSDFVTHIPVMALHPQSDDLILGSPDVRRRYLDRAAFFLETRFAEHFRQFSRALKQRNAALKTQQATAPWDPLFLQSGQEIETIRQQTLEGIRVCLPPLMTALAPELDLSIDYEPGYRQDESLAGALERSAQRERLLGNTLYGPHRADLRLFLNGREARHSASRGQIKVASTVLNLAVLSLWREVRHRHAVLLFDDLPAELDGDHLSRLLEQLSGHGHQTFLTTVGNTQVESRSDRIFQVREGLIQELVY